MFVSWLVVCEVGWLVSWLLMCEVGWLVVLLVVGWLRCLWLVGCLTKYKYESALIQNIVHGVDVLPVFVGEENLGGMGSPSTSSHYVH